MVKQEGYIAIVLLIFVVVSVVIATAAVGVSISNLMSVSAYEQGIEALGVAESGVENAIIRLIRDPTYTGETLVIGTNSAEITITGTNPQTIRSVGSAGTKKRTFQVVVDRTSGILSVTSWAEVYN